MGATITRYQIRIVDADLTELVHQIATNVVTEIVRLTEGLIWSHEIYPAVFRACKDSLRDCVRGFHVCGCARHCDLESEPAELAGLPPPPQEFDRIRIFPTRIHRYVLSLDVPLRDFVRGMEFKILRAIADLSPVKNWHRKLFPAIRETVEPMLGRHIFYSPTCNRGEYICEVGACTEFDPWEHVQPSEPENSRDLGNPVG